MRRCGHDRAANDGPERIRRPFFGSAIRNLYRSKGVMVFFASQSPNDYQQEFFNFQELLGFAYILRCQGVSGASIPKILGCSIKTGKELQTEIARLEPWKVVSRSVDKTEEFVKFTAETFYKKILNT